MRPARDIEGCTAAHAALLHTIDALGDDDVGRPSLLPDWTVGHVLTHLARNADSHVRMLAAAMRGEVVDQYAPDQRVTEIEDGAARPAATIVADVHTSIAALEALWHAVRNDVWVSGRSRRGGAEGPVADLPFLRWREVEIHHADLGLAYTPADWSDGYVAVELPRTLATLDDRIPSEDRRRVLAWLLGRRDEPAWPSIEPWQGDRRRA